MVKDGNIFVPVVEGKTYLNKPPLKMWISALVSLILGDTNFAYRFPDAISGFIVTLLAAIVSIILFNSYLAAIVAAFSILGCQTIMLMHGFRSSNQDAMLILLTQLALLAGYFVLTPSSKISSALRTNSSLICGILVGLSMLVKSVGGLIVYIVMGVFYLFSRALKTYPQIDRRLFFNLIIPAILIPSLYLIPQLLFIPNSGKVIIGDEILRRVTVGYHNRNDYLLYFRRMIIDRLTLPPELITLGLFDGFKNFLSKNDWSQLYLICAGMVPIIFYSLIPSRLNWYISPAIPSLAILSGGAIATVLLYLSKNFSQLKSNFQLPMVIRYAVASCVIIWTPVALAMNLTTVGHIISNPQDQLSVDRLTRDFTTMARKYPEVRFYWALFDWLKFERPAIHSLGDDGIYLATNNEIESTLRSSDNFLLAFPVKEVLPIIKTRKPLYYSTIENRGEQVSPIIIFSYLSTSPGPSFKPFHQILDTKSGDLIPASGLALKSERSGTVKLCSQTDRADVAFEGDALMTKLGNSITLRYTLPIDVYKSVTAYLNNHKLGNLPTIRTKESHHSIKFQIPPERFNRWENVVTFKMEFNDTGSANTGKENEMLCIENLTLDMTN